LSVGADVNAKDTSPYDNWTSLHRASNKGHVQVVKELREHGADIEAKAHFGSTPLHIAVWNDHLAVVIELLGHGAEIQSICTNGTSTSILGKRKSRGADIEAKDNDGRTPLHCAALRDHLPVVKALLSGGADILAVNNQGHLPIDAALYYRRSAVIKYLLQHFYATTCRLPLHELVEDLTWIGNPDSRVGVPPLRAALHRDLLRTDDVMEILKYLVDRKPASLSSRDRDGSLPLHVACRRGAPFTIVQSLVNIYKASVKSRTPQGDFPLFLACEMPEPSLDTIYILVKLYPDLVLYR
jgi:ankyrin repeat protein